MYLAGSAYLSVRENRDDDLTPTVGIARDMPRELQHIRHDNGIPCRRGCSAHPAAKPDLLAGGFPLEWPQEEFAIVALGVRCGNDRCRQSGGAVAAFGTGKDGESIIADVEPGPIDGRGWLRESGVCVPEQGCYIGKVARVRISCIVRGRPISNGKEGEFAFGGKIWVSPDLSKARQLANHFNLQAIDIPNCVDQRPGPEPAPAIARTLVPWRTPGQRKRNQREAYCVSFVCINH